VLVAMRLAAGVRGCWASSTRHTNGGGDLSCRPLGTYSTSVNYSAFSIVTLPQRLLLNKNNITAITALSLQNGLLR